MKQLHYCAFFCFPQHVYIMYTSTFLVFRVLLISFLVKTVAGHGTNFTWTGGPLHLECELMTNLLKTTGQYVRDNVIVIKHITYRDKVYVLTPRLKHGVMSTVSEIVMGRKDVELQPYPDLQSHTLSNCEAIQNAVDFYVDSFSTLWILDNGLIETLESPRCTCPPKVLSINLFTNKITKTLDLLNVAEPTSILQYIVVDYGLTTKPHLYISDASRGVLIVYDTATDSSWITYVCKPAQGMQIALLPHPTHSTLLIVRVPFSGIIEIDTSSLQRKHSNIPLRVYGDHASPFLLLGTEATSHQIFIRFKDATEIFAWNTKTPFNITTLSTIYTPLGLIPMSVSKDPLWPSLVVLESNYADCMKNSAVPFHRLTYLSIF